MEQTVALEIWLHSWWVGGHGGGGAQKPEGSHQECTVIVSRIGPVVSELCVGVCIIRSVNQSNKRCIYSDSSTWLLDVLIFLKQKCFD